MTENQHTQSVVTAAILIIGDEILSGRTQDVNLNHIAKSLNQLGVQVKQARVLPDEQSVIVDAVNYCRTHFNYVFTTGGIGPTHDDITADCIAAAFGVELSLHPEIVKIIERRPAPPDIMASRMRMARIPEGARLIENSTGGPPGFQIENVFVMAGIPSIMQAMMASLDHQRIIGGRVMASTSLGVYTSESEIARPLAEIDQRFDAVSIGSYPFRDERGYGTTLVMRSTESSALAEATEAVRELILALGHTPIEHDRK